MQRKHVLASAFAAASALAAILSASPAMAQDDSAPAPNNQYTDDMMSRWQFRDASSNSFFRMTRLTLLGREVVDRNGVVVGQIVNDARWVNGDLAGVEVTQPDNRVAWIKVVDLRFNRRADQMFTRLSPEQTTERARFAGNNPFPVGVGFG